MTQRKNWSYYKPGDLLMRIRMGEEPADYYENPYIAGALALGDRLLTAADLLERRDGFQRAGKPMILEVGCYKGTTLTTLAMQNPHCRFLGIDIKYKRVVRSRQKLDRAGIGDQVTVAIIDLVDCLEILLPDSLQGICIFYPDPWQKERFEERRLFSAFTAELMYSRLAPDGFLWIKTDHPEYLDQIQESLSPYSLVTDHPPPSPLQKGQYPTDFERLFLSQGKALFDLCLRKGND
jgi:tRNA (guanine-N7-)-methyltransferase